MLEVVERADAGGMFVKCRKERHAEEQHQYGEQEGELDPKLLAAKKQYLSSLADDLMAERGHWIDAAGAERREEAGQERDG